MADRKVSVNGTTSAYSPTVQDSINLALLQNGGIKRIQSAFQDRLEAAGWTQNVRDYVERLFRSGDAATYDEAMRMIMQNMGDIGGSGGGSGGNVSAPDLAIPLEVVKDGAEVVKKELKGILTLGDGKDK